MKHAAVFFDKPGFEDYPFTNKKEYRPAYHELAELVTRRGGTFSIVRSMETYQGGMTFSRGWTYEDGEFHEVTSPITPDLIYNKGRFRGDVGARVLNDPEFDHLCIDKWKTYLAFPRLSPPTVLVR